MTGDGNECCNGEQCKGPVLDLWPVLYITFPVLGTHRGGQKTTSKRASVGFWDQQGVGKTYKQCLKVIEKQGVIQQQLQRTMSLYGKGVLGLQTTVFGTHKVVHIIAMENATVR